MSKRIIAIDIGNTRTKIGLVDTNERKCTNQKSRLNIPETDKYLHNIKYISEKMSDNRSAECVVCSVVPGLTGQVAEAVKPQVNSLQILKYSKKLPLSFSYENPDKLGADRIANSLYAASEYKGKDVIVIDAGSTITIDYISKKNCFEGGVILPGLEMQYSSLSKNTARLPYIDKIEGDIGFPGKSTESCIKLGVADGTAGAVSSILNRYIDHFKISPTVITCGGSWHAIKTRIQFKHEHIPECTLLGTGIYGEQINNGDSPEIMC